MKNKTHKDIVRKISNMNPYKEKGNRESYSSYNEGWSDACDVILAEIEEMGQVESKRPNIQDYKKRATGWYKDNGDDYDNDLQNYIDLLEEKLSQHFTEQPTRELSEEDKIEVFSRDECIFKYCPHPELCKDECQSKASTLNDKINKDNKVIDNMTDVGKFMGKDYDKI